MSIELMRRSGPPATRRLARSIGLGAVLALTGVFAPALHAQTECDDVSGAWLVDLSLPGSGTQRVTLTIEQTACEVSGLVEGQRETVFEGGTVEGPTATFDVDATNPASGQSVTTTWKATVEGDTISGTLEAELVGSIAFTGTRVKEQDTGRLDRVGMPDRAATEASR